MISDFDVQCFQQYGVIVLRGILPVDEVNLLRRGIEEVLLNPSPRAIVASATDDPGFFGLKLSFNSSFPIRDP